MCLAKSKELVTPLIVPPLPWALEFREDIGGVWFNWDDAVRIPGEQDFAFLGSPNAKIRGEMKTFHANE